MQQVPNKRRWKFRGICADAAALGVHRHSLAEVLKGNRPGNSLLQRYHALKTAQNQTAQSHETKPL
jgi:hypothetical protein